MRYSVEFCEVKGCERQPSKLVTLKILRSANKWNEKRFKLCVYHAALAVNQSMPGQEVIDVIDYTPGSH